MNKHAKLWRTITVAAAIFVAVQLPGRAEAAFGDTILKFGMSGNDVQTLQTELKELGYFTATATGYYGPLTKDAVIRFQQASGLDVDGIVGPQTFRALEKRLLQARIAGTAQRYIGVPYVWGGQSPTGFDCSGFTGYVFARNGLTLPRVSEEQFNAGVPVPKSQLEAGDLVFFSTYKPGPSHVGIYLGDGTFIHASSSKGVTISSLSNPYWTAHYIGARSYF
ncbi:C40 family peptidase [Effusibacillus pohliae]|uniref:C40 family peptidase n=1 Tax=Effusibacillus pohliae TaxID=232270 RepID=UPI0003759418|nr:NlpC/P60 family protein [Effusibacillus pohliae]